MKHEGLTRYRVLCPPFRRWQNMVNKTKETKKKKNLQLCTFNGYLITWKTNVNITYIAIAWFNLGHGGYILWFEIMFHFLPTFVFDKLVCSRATTYQQSLASRPKMIKKN